MDLGFLDKTSPVVPLLVQLYDNQRLHDLANNKQPLARAKLTGVVAELLEMELSVREVELISDILIELMRQAEIDLRQALAERLSVMENVPLRLILQITNDEIVVADPVLKYSPVLNDLDLIYIIKSKTPEYWRSIAQRKSLGSLVVNNLIKTQDQQTCVNVSANAGAEISACSFASLCDMAQGSNEIAQSLAARDDVPDDLKPALYQIVGKELSNSMFGVSLEQEELACNIADIVDELSGKRFFEPTEIMKSTAKRLQQRGEITVDMMIGVLRRRQFPSFIAQFSEFTGQSTETVATFLQQETGQGLAVSCKAVGIEKHDFVSIFLLTHKMRSTSLVTEISDLGRAVEYFNCIDQATAQNIVKGQSG